MEVHVASRGFREVQGGLGRVREVQGNLGRGSCEEINLGLRKV